MVQRGDDTSFVLEALAETLEGNLDGNDPLKARVTGLVHLTHSTRANSFEELVGAQAGTARQWHALGPRRYCITASRAARFRLSGIKLRGGTFRRLCPVRLSASRHPSSRV